MDRPALAAKDDVTEQAAAWLVALDSHSADPAAFEAWRQADPRHALAFAEMASTWQQLDHMQLVWPRPDAQAQEACVPTPAFNRRHLLRGGLATAAVAGMGGFAYRAVARDSASTGIGQRRQFTCWPGGEVMLNTDSKLAWRDKAGQRKLWLERGEVSLRLGPMDTPVLLATPAATLTLFAGQYNVRIREAGCQLTVLSGQAQLSGCQPMRAGQTVLLGQQGCEAVTSDALSLARVQAWQQEQILLEGESLDYAVAEYNRYLEHKIILGDPALSRLRLGGRFNTGDVEGFLQAITLSLDIRVVKTRDGDMVLTRG
jgi:transmembrane sensor